MALPQDGQNANALATVKEVPTGKKLIFVDPTTNEGGIITLEDLTTQILKKLTSQTFALDQGTKTLPAALNELNSNGFFIPIKEGIRYKGDDSIMNVANIPNNTVYFRIIMMDEIHPVLLSSGGILVGYLLQPDYYRQMFYSSQVIASRTCYGGKWSDWQLITKL